MEVLRPGAASLGRRRQIVGWAMALVGPPLLAALLVPARGPSLSFEAMLFLGLAVACALVGGRWPAVAASVLGTLLLNYYFTAPLHTLSIASGHNVLTLLVLLLTSVAVSAVVDSAARRRDQATRARTEADALSLLNRTVLGGAYDVSQLLRLAEETFRASRAELVPPDVVVGDDDSAAPATSKWRLVLRDRSLDAAGQRLLVAYASHVGVLLLREELARQTAAARELEEGNRTRTALLAAVSHDLRTPLAGIRSAAETLRLHDERLGPRERGELLLALEQATARLTVMVSDLLDMSRLQTGAVLPSLEDAPLAEVVRRALVALPGAERVSLGELPWAHVDTGLLERVVANLVANALHHSDAVEVCGERLGMRVHLRVVDHGPGVPEAERAAMFEPFQRLGDTAAGEGVGLGLAVARGLSEAQGGHLEATGTPGGGLTMLVDLPGVELAEEG